MNIQDLYRTINQGYMKANGQYGNMQNSLNRTKQNMERCEADAEDAAEAYADAKRNVQQIKTQLQALAAEAANLMSELQKSPGKDEDQQGAEQERQQAKQRLQQVRAEIASLQNQQQKEEAEAEKQSARYQSAKQMAEQHRELLGQIMTGCEMAAAELQSYVTSLDSDIIPTYGTASTGFTGVASTRFKGSAQQASNDMRQKQSSARALSSQIAQLAARYAQLADAAESAQGSGSSGSNAANASMGGKSRGMGGRGKQLAVGAMVAASMATGVAFHATRPASTFDSSHTPMQVMEERWDGIQDSITPDDYVSDMEKRRELEEWTAPQKRLRR